MWFRHTDFGELAICEESIVNYIRHLLPSILHKFSFRSFCNNVCEPLCRNRAKASRGSRSGIRADASSYLPAYQAALRSVSLDEFRGFYVAAYIG